MNEKDMDWIDVPDEPTLYPVVEVKTNFRELSSSIVVEAGLKAEVEVEELEEMEDINESIADLNTTLFKKLMKEAEEIKMRKK